MGECLEHSSIEIIIESRLPVWILGKVYQQKKDQEFWSVARFRKFLQEIVQRNGEVQRSQASSNGYQRKSIESKSSHNPRSARGETSALAAIKQPKPNDSKRITNSRKYPGNNKIQRPCSFYNEDHWKDECQVYQTANQRLNCLQKGHIVKDCRKLKKLCFHLQRKIYSALCSNHRKDTRSEKLREEKLESTMMNNTVAEQIRSEGKRILLLCKEISVTNPEIPKFQRERWHYLI
uniref:CCHC-type domain-containing protein n=1 Tax=Loa loa TaxID=7209 RepID=A0A1I7V6B4_LOALO